MIVVAISYEQAARLAAKANLYYLESTTHGSSKGTPRMVHLKDPMCPYRFSQFFPLPHDANLKFVGTIPQLHRNGVTYEIRSTRMYQEHVDENLLYYLQIAQLTPTPSRYALNSQQAQGSDHACPGVLPHSFDDRSPI